MGIVEPMACPRSAINELEPLAALGERYGAPTFASVDELFESGVEVDGLLVCTTHASHYELGVRGLVVLGAGRALQQLDARERARLHRVRRRRAARAVGRVERAAEVGLALRARAAGHGREQHGERLERKRERERARRRARRRQRGQSARARARGRALRERRARARASREPLRAA